MASSEPPKVLLECAATCPRANPLAAGTSAAGARDDVGDPTLYVTLNADYVTPGFVKPGWRERRGARKRLDVN